MAGEYLSYLRDEVDDLIYPRGTRDNSALNCQELLDSGNQVDDGKLFNLQRLSWFVCNLT